MLLAIGHDDAQFVGVRVDRVPGPVQWATVEDRLLLEMAVGSRGHVQILTSPAPVLNALALCPVMTGASPLSAVGRSA